MTDQQHDPEMFRIRRGPSLREQALRPAIAELSGLLSSPQDESLVDLAARGLRPVARPPLATAFSDVKPVSLDDLKRDADR